MRQIQIANYTSLDLIYEGRHSLIFKGMQILPKRPVVIKVLNHDYPTPQQLGKFKHEYEITVKLNKALPDKIIEPLDLISIQNTLGIVLEDYGAISLDHFIRQHPLDFASFLQIAINLSQILGQIHQEGILHKDINPSNILINAQDHRIKMIDFGISTQLSFENYQVQSVNAIEGTLYYISPEQTGRMNRVVDYRSDYYSLGMTFYEMASGQRAFQGQDSLELLYSHLAKTPLAPHEVNPAIPESLSDMIMKLLKKTPEERYQSSFGLTEDLKQCLEYFRQQQTIPHFKISQKDISLQFHISEKLYGRDQEIQSLIQAFKNVADGQSNLILVSGEAGVGKSALIHEVNKPIAAHHGYYTYGKCDQFKKNEPYDCLIQALQRLIQQILTEPNHRLTKWKNILQKAVGINGKIITDLVPLAKVLLGPQPPIEESSQNESQNRFKIVFLDFMQALTNEGHAIAFFLDDLQWIDYASLELLTKLLMDADTHHFFLIGAYRSNEIQETHHFHRFLDDLKKKTLPYTHLHLTPLKLEHVEQLLSETLRQPIDQVHELAMICLAKTQGNPFFLNRLLLSLNEEKLITFDINQGKWIWDLTKIRKKDISENVVEFMSKKILQLSLATQQMLHLAACIGNSFDLQQLAKYAGIPLQNAKDALWEAISEGLIVPENSNYMYVENESKAIIPFRFLHDRVQQATYLLIPNENKMRLHYLIGMTSLNYLSEEKIEENLFPVTNQLNQGESYLKDDQEKLKLMALNLRAGIKAKNASAFPSALSYLQNAKRLAPPNAWDALYDTMSLLMKHYCECLYLVGEHQQAQESVEESLKYAKNVLDKATIISKQVVYLTDAGKVDDAIEAALEGLKLLGVKLNRNPSRLLILKEFIFAKWNLRGRQAADLIHLPDVSDPQIKIIYQLMENSDTPTYYAGDLNLMGLIALKKLNLLLKHGNVEGSSNCYMAFAVMLQIMGNLKQAVEFSELALKLSKKIESKHYRSRVLVIYAHMVRGWHYHWNTLREYFLEATRIGLETGDIVTYTLGMTYILLWDPEIPQDQLIKESKRVITFLKSTKSPQALETGKIQFQMRASLCGQTKTPFDLDDEDFNEKKSLERMEKTHLYTGLAMFHHARSILHYHYNDFTKALEYLHKLDQVYEAVGGGLFFVEYTYYTFYINSALYPDLAGKEKRKAWRRMRKNLQTIKKWAGYAPFNFRHHQLLMEAELAKHLDEFENAAQLYEDAIKMAKHNGYIRFEALSNELTAHFYFERGFKKIAKTYLTEARYCYQKWGVQGKIKQLEDQYPDLLPPLKPLGQYRETTTSNGTEQTSSEVLDLISVMKASQTITREIQLPKLIEKMMRIVIENAGAEKGYLLLEKEGKFVVKAFADHELIQIDPNLTMEDLPSSIIRIAASSREPIVIDEAMEDERFNKDPLIVKSQSKSILCFPLLNLGIVKGMLFLENNLAQGVFTHERLNVINILSSQMAISIDNALFYGELEEKVQERTRELKETQNQLIQKEKMAFLGLLTTGIGHEMKNPLNFIINFSEMSKEIIQELLLWVKAPAAEILSKLPLIESSLNFLSDHTQVTLEQGKKADTIVNRMIEHSAITGQQFVPTDIHHLLEQSLNIILKKVQNEHPELKVQVEKELHHPLPILKVADVDLQRVFINLFDNAFYTLHLKKMQNPDFIPILTIRTDQKADTFEIHIEDNGLGIAPQYYQKIFTPFFTTRAPGQGVGLGLSLCHNIIVKEHSGSLSFESREGLSTDFIIHLPQNLPTND